VSIERWLSRRGLPQLIEGYGTERSIDIRTIRWVLAWAAVQVVVLSWTAPASLEIRGASIVAGLVALVAYVYGYKVLTGRDLWRPRDALTWYDVVLTAIVPAVAAGLRYGSPVAAIDGALVHLQGVLVIYAFVGFGLLWILAWSVGWLVSQMPHLIGLAARTLPLVLILVIFLLFTSEIWEAAAQASVIEVVAVVAIAALIGFAFLGSRVPSDLESLESASKAEDVARLVSGTPAEALLPIAGDVPAPPKLSRLQRWNVGLVLVISQALQATLVSAIVVIFLVAVGLLMAPESVQAEWAGAPVQPILTFEALGELRVLSFELFVVTTLLGTFAGVYFAGFALGDERYRAEAVSGTLDDLSRALAVRTVYIAASGAHPGAVEVVTPGLPERG